MDGVGEGVDEGGVGCAVLVPVKAFALAKARLAPALDGPARTALARRMAAHVVAAAAPLPVTVACDDPEVAGWARSVGAEVSWSPGRGLNGAVADGVARLGAAGFDRVMVTHADLPMLGDLAPLVAGPGVALAPDRRQDGTNVISLPAATGFRFSYGPGSFHRHRAEAARLGLAVRVVRSNELAWDVDVPADLALPEPCA